MGGGGGGGGTGGGDNVDVVGVDGTGGGEEGSTWGGFLILIFLSFLGFSVGAGDKALTISSNFPKGLFVAMLACLF